MMDLLCTLLEILLLVLSVASKRKSNADDSVGSREYAVSFTPEMTLEFMGCTNCGKLNQLGSVSCSVCGALQEAARI